MNSKDTVINTNHATNLAAIKLIVSTASTIDRKSVV